MPDERADDVFELPMDGTSKPEETPSPKKKTAKKKTAKKKTPKKKAEPKPPADDEVDVNDDAAADDLSELPSETRVAESIDRNAMAVNDEAALADTLPNAEDPLQKAKRENFAVARWDKFLSRLTRGTMELIHEMGISGLEEGPRPLTNFRRSDLVKPAGLMLDQHADAIEGELASLGLTLLPEPSNWIKPGDPLPNNHVPNDVRTAREIRRRNLRSTM